jgi:predicted 3-demethylubiquinone-9 3-methyltransferase (glyoxalase superfamily)
MQKITPFLWFDHQAVEAATFYTSVFPDSSIKKKEIMKNTPSGTVEIVTIELFGQDFTLMSAGPVFKFNEAISFVVNCKGQEEVDYYWKKLSHDPKSEQCGWLKDKYGVSWQIVPHELTQYIAKDTSGRVVQAMLTMKKIDIEKLKRAYENK